MSHRTQIVLTDELYARLSQESARSGASLAELVRRALTAAYVANPAPDATAVLRSTFGAWPDRDFDGAAYVEQLRRGLARRLER